MRKRFSDVEEEDFFLDADEKTSSLGKRLGKNIGRIQKETSHRMDPTRVQVAIQYGAPSAIDMALDWTIESYAWLEALSPELTREERALVAKKALSKDPRQLTLNLLEDAAAIINEALDAGFDLGIQTLPKGMIRVRDESDSRSWIGEEEGLETISVDRFSGMQRADLEKMRAGAERLARTSLRRGIFAKSVDALRESRNGIRALVEASRHPSMRFLKNPDLIVSSLGINRVQAVHIVRTAQGLLDAGANEKIVYRRMMQMIGDAARARADTIAQTLTAEAINVGQQSIYEHFENSGFLDPEEWEREWVTRRDDIVCEDCDDFDAQRAPIDEPFVSWSGNLEAFRPEIHPKGRCRTRLVKKRGTRRRSRRPS